MKKKIIIFILTLTMYAHAFAQGIKLNVSEGELEYKETWYFNYLESSQTIVEVKSTLPLTFSSSTDAGITQMDKKPEEAGYYFYELIFPTTTSKKSYRGRTLSLKSNGFETVEYPLPSLESKKPVALLVMREADALFNAGNYSAAQVEYEKEANRDPSNEYLKSKIVACKDNLSVQKADALYNAQNFSASLLEYQNISSSYFNREYVNERIRMCNDAILLKEADKLITEMKWKEALTKLNAISVKSADINAKIQQCEKELEKVDILITDYASMLKEANEYFIHGKYKEALSLYTDLQKSQPDKLIEQKITDCQNKLYEQKLQTANQSYKAKKYSNARSLYGELRTERPDDIYVIQQIERCDKGIIYEANNPLDIFAGYMYSTPSSHGFMIGGCKKWGFYISGKISSRGDKPNDKSLSYSDFELSDKVKHSRQAFSVGPMFHIWKPLYLYAGAGYGSYCDKYEITNYVNMDDQEKESTCYYYDNYKKGWDVECGLIVRLLTMDDGSGCYVSAGYNALLVDKPIRSISIGAGFSFVSK